MAEPSLLPPTPTDYELSISEAVADWYDVPSEILDTLWDPRTCPPDVLPHLASALRVPLWFDDWPVAKQRSVTAAWIRLSRRLGREPTFAELLRIVDAELVRFIAAPQVTTPTRARTDAEREAFKARFPEVRVYLYRNRGVRNALFTCGWPLGGYRRVARASTAPERAGRRAEVCDRGIVTPITIRVESGTAEFALSSLALRLPATGLRLVPGRAWAGAARASRSSSAASRVYRYREGTARPDLLWPTAQPLDIRPDRIREPHVRRGGLVVGRVWGAGLGAARASDARLFVYDSMRLFDPARRGGGQVGVSRGGWILGSSRLGMPPFEAELVVDASYRRPGRGGFPRLPGVVRAHDGSRMASIAAAVRGAKLGRDKIMIRTGLYGPITPNDAVQADGAHRLGDIIKRSA